MGFIFPFSIKFESSAATVLWKSIYPPPITSVSIYCHDEMSQLIQYILNRYEKQLSNDNFIGISQKSYMSSLGLLDSM